MRTVGAGTITQALIDTQKDASRTPYIDITINGTNYWSRLEYLEYHEEAYRERATIGLNNRDRALDGLDLDGKEFSIKLGYDTSAHGGSTTDTVTYPTMWVKSHQIVSAMGQRYYQIYAEGMWMMLREKKIDIGVDGDQDDIYSNTFNRTHTIEALIKLVIGAMGWTWTAVTSANTDGIINNTNHNPLFEINRVPFENAAAILYRLIWMTKGYLRAKPNTTFEFVYPQGSDTVDETYYSDQANWFTEYVEKTILLVPNSIIVLANQDPDTLEWNTPGYPLVVGTAKDNAQIAKYTEVIEVFLVGSITSKAAADARAEAILSKLQSETLGGRLVAPHDCQVEPYDKVLILDSRL